MIERLEKIPGLSGSTLKLLAMISMVIDHIGCFLVSPDARVFFTLAGHRFTLCLLMRAVGRIAFPLFAFLLTEGFLHTHDRKRYALSLLVFALISELPWNLIHSGSLLGYDRQNIFFTLLLGYLGLCALEYLKDRQPLQLTAVIGLFMISCLLKADYSYRGYLLILLLYLLREYPLPRALAGTAALSSSLLACCSAFAYIPIAFYNGQRGFIRSPFGKYFFYAFYPLHLLLLYTVKQNCF